MNRDIEDLRKWIGPCACEPGVGIDDCPRCTLERVNQYIINLRGSVYMTVEFGQEGRKETRKCK